MIGFLFCLCFWLLPCQVQAASTADATELISLEEECTLTLMYGYDGTYVSEIPVTLYQVAQVSADFQYTLTSEFAPSGLVVNGIRSTGEWNVIRSSLESYLLANHVEGVAAEVTNSQGKASFDSLEPGLYLTSAVHVVEEERELFFEAALISLPGLGENGCWQYQVQVAPKPEVLPLPGPDDTDQDIQLKVLKLWKGDAGRTDRPQEIQVEIFRNGVSYRTVTLSEENQWSYSWTVKEDGADWMVAERNVPSGYTATVEERTTSFVITNARIPETPPIEGETPPTEPPKTGDTSHIMLYLVLMQVSGATLVFLGIVRKKRRI